MLVQAKSGFYSPCDLSQVSIVFCNIICGYMRFTFCAIEGKSLFSNLCMMVF